MNWFEIRYKGCPHCEHRCEKRLQARKKEKDQDALAELEAKRIKEWYPKNQLYYDDGTPFLIKKERFDSQVRHHHVREQEIWLQATNGFKRLPPVRSRGDFISVLEECWSHRRGRQRCRRPVTRGVGSLRRRQRQPQFRGESSSLVFKIW